MSSLEITPLRLVVAFAFMLVTSLFVSRRAGLGLERDLIVGAIRGAVQLAGAGYVLLALFRNQRPVWVALALAAMLGAAGWTSARRVESGPSRRVLLPRALAAIGAPQAPASRYVAALAGWSRLALRTTRLWCPAG